jgi:hypothetical protein
MIKGFEKITYELTDLEKDYAEHIYDMMSENKERYYTSTHLCESIGIKQEHNARIRKMIHYLREDVLEPDEYIIADSYGYMLTKDVHKIWNYVVSLKQRISSQLSILDTAMARLDKEEK